MAISVNWSTKVISVPKSYLTSLGGSRYSLDLNIFRLDLKALEADSQGIIWPDITSHNTEVTLSWIAYARTVEIINGYTVDFENGMYSILCVGANHNILDVKTVNSVSLNVGNSAGLISVNTGGWVDYDALANAVVAKILELPDWIFTPEQIELLVATVKKTDMIIDTEEWSVSIFV